jgi:cell division protein FtsA
MSRPRRLVAGLDLGSTKTCAVIAEIVGDLPRRPVAKVLGVGLARNGGVRRGVVRDIDETTRSVVAALRDAERMAGVKVPDVTCGIAGEHVAARPSNGVVAVTAEEITPADVERANEVARAVSLGRDHELLHDIPQEYIVDQQRGISDPVGMTGMRLEVEMYLVTVQSPAAQNLRKSVQRAGYRVADLVLEPLAASYATLTDDERELGVALVDLGGGSTGVALFHEGKIRHLTSLPWAGSRVTSDLVQGLGVTQTEAERVKERHGAAYKPLVDPAEMVTLPSTPGQAGVAMGGGVAGAGAGRQAPRELVAEIIHQRVDEIFGLVAREFDKAGYDARRLPAGVVLTGGTAHLPGIVELARDVFGMPVRTGVPELGISGLVDSVQAPRYAVPVGLVLYAAHKSMRGAAAGMRGSGVGMGASSVGSLAAGVGGGVERIIGPLKRWLQDFF